MILNERAERQPRLAFEKRWHRCREMEMQKTIEQLMDDRHRAYVLACADNFRTVSTTLLWREANRVYVLARDAAQRARPDCRRAAA